MGLHTIHTIVYNPATFDVSMIQLGTTTAAQVNAMLIQGGGEICASLDMEGVALYVEEPMTPTLTANMSQVCIEGGSATVSATAGGGMYLPMGYSYIHVLTKGEEKVIKELSMTPSFTVTETGHYTIHTFVYDPETFPLGTLTPGVSTAYDLQAMLVYGGGIYCAVLDMTGVSVHVLECDEDDCPAYAGSLLPLKSIFCYVETGSVIGATVVGDAVVPPGYVARWVATQGTEMVIVGFGETAWFVVDGMGLHTIHTIVYNPATFDVSMIQLGTTTAAQVNAMLIQGGGEICASLDMTGVALYVEEPSTPMLTATTDEVCLTGGTAVVSATAGAGMSLPMGYSYTHVLSMGYDKVIMEYSMTPSFTVTAAGHYTVHTFVYDPETFPLDMLTPGVSTAFDLHGMTVYGGGIYCAVLDVMGASVDVIVCEPVECVAFAGTLTAAAMETCLMEGSAMISAMGNADMVVPAGYSTAYVLTMDGVIMDTGSDLSFTVTGTGTYTIHTLVYHPATLDLGVVTPGVTTAAAVNALLIQGGGTICASLDLVGATTMVIVCEPVDCDAYAGTLTPHHFETCLADGSVVITAEGNDDMFVPEGYSTIYVLTMGGVIMDVGSALSFTVTSPGSYTFHTLVYDPTTLDLSIVTPGVTTAASVNALLIQGGGTICASLDLVGATTMVIDCTIDCPAAAGTISASMSDACLEEGMAMLVATPGGDAVVPEGYETIYVLTMDPGLIIEQVGPDPEFEVTMEGDYRIHTLVYDPLTLDLTIVVPGVTPATVVNALLFQGGGDICASLDLMGAMFTVTECPAGCPAMAGSIIPEDSALCLEEGMAELIAIPGEDAVVPEGYAIAYVLTEGLLPVIQEVGDMPEFTVMSTGVYTIHTLVYDSLTLDLSVLAGMPALTAHGLLVQGGGTICAALDLIGATFNVDDCVECLAFAGTLTADSLVVCLEDGMVILHGMPSGDAVVPAGFATLYLLAYGETQTIMEVSDGPSMLVTAEGGYTMHTLVYDPSTLSLGFITLTETTLADLIAVVMPMEGTLCASLDVDGVSFSVEDCGIELLITNAWPVPTAEQLTIEMSVPAGPTSQLALFNSMGQQVTSNRSIGAGTTQITLDVSNLETGMYTIRLMSERGLATYNFTKGH
jgi:hypothetical protein